jgi:FHS family L-fucose permease-like MFS transporter
LGFFITADLCTAFTASLGGSYCVKQAAAGGINSLGTTIGPIVVSIALFGVIAGLILKNLLKKKTLWIL